MKSLRDLLDIIAKMDNSEELERFFEEIFTPKELFAGETQRKVASRHRISLCKITRGSKILKKKNSMSLKILQSNADAPLD